MTFQLSSTLLSTYLHNVTNVRALQIVKERQMEFDVDSDPDTLYDLFGDDFETFAE